MKADLNIAAWQILVALADDAGFVGASMKLDIDMPTCTRLIKALEELLGFALIDHRRRPARLTDRARELLPAARDLVRAHDKLGKLAAQSNRRKMRITVSIPINSPRTTMYRIIKKYETIDPLLRVDVHSDCDHEDVLAGKVDAAYLPYRPVPDGLVIWDINRIANVPVASPSYIVKHGNPKSPRDLKGHSVIIRSARNYPMTTYLVKGDEKCSLDLPEISFAGDVPSGIAVALAGDGIALDLSFFVCKTYLKTGELVPVLGGWHRPYWNIALVMARSSLGNSRLTAFLSYFAKAEQKDAEVRSREVESWLARLC